MIIGIELDTQIVLDTVPALIYHEYAREDRPTCRSRARSLSCGLVQLRRRGGHSQWGGVSHYSQGIGALVLLDSGDDPMGSLSDFLFPTN